MHQGTIWRSTLERMPHAFSDNLMTWPASDTIGKREIKMPPPKFSVQCSAVAILRRYSGCLPCKIIKKEEKMKLSAHLYMCAWRAKFYPTKLSGTVN